MVFYSRMYIQESMFACFTLAFAIALGRAIRTAASRRRRGAWRWPLLAGCAAGLAIATKETAVLALPASLAAVRRWHGGRWERRDPPPRHASGKP
jgi:4-amino-4-deoxy-L-arabinose transferase-like glycosyltransferase